MIGWAWAAVAIIWIATSLSSKRTIRTQSVGSRLAHLGLALLAGLLMGGSGPWKPVLGWHVVAKSSVSANIGLALTLAGLSFAVWARFVLGRNWSGTVTVKQDHELVRSGPYVIVRHPIYSGFLFALLGTAIARGVIGAFIGMLIAALALRLKSLTEESFMIEKFGSHYTTYKREVKSLIPFVW
jgi:protein-S-isoprenylcysteine O-methyltransferase Ste14